ncbi:Diaminopimelate epimerase-like protein [Sanghuangporus baumii]|uniref:Diaminopimelate epimerase-like protein n=1 Tax=Sanghuangporus baumii TaxID=108892 RepID=A0A9Q5I4E6_SANBA|nr:Diaminopimelate epimerase-like protein [Sanghuangporus baumii]
MTPQAYPFSLVNAFSGSPFGGNPAAVIILNAPFDDHSLYLKVARNFNQPIACFVFPVEDVERESEPDQVTKTFRIRWFTVAWESEICGHGALAAAHALLSHPELVPPHIHVLRFKSMHGYVYARRIQIPDAPERIEIELPTFDAKPVETKEFDRIRSVVCKAFRRDVKVAYIGIASGEGGSESYLLIELDENEELEGTDVDTAAFVGRALALLR